MDRQEFVKDVEESSKEFADRSSKLFNQAYFASLGAVELARQQSSEFFGNLVETGEKVDKEGRDFLKKQFEEQRGQLQDWRRDALGYVEESLERFRVSIQGRFERLGTAIQTIEERLKRLEEEIAPLPVDNYDELTVREILPKLENYDVLELRAIKKHEAANKDRVTVLDAVDERLSELTSK